MESQSRLAIIDADSIVWTTAYLNREDSSQMFEKLDFFIVELLTNVTAKSYVGVLGREGSGSVRKDISAKYKATRPDRPDYYKELAPLLIKYLLDRWQFVLSPPGYEADDVVASIASKYKQGDCVICGIDKDLKQIPGLHYNYSKKSFETIGKEDADYKLWTQVLVGDTTDNIKGCPGVGSVGAKKILDNVEDSSYYEAVVLNEFVMRLGIRPGVAAFSEAFLMVRLKEDLEFEIKENPWQ